MRTTNAMQLKSIIKARAKASGVSPQLMMQDYMLERLLEHISLSVWRDNFIIKGGMLIASLIGVDSRVTKDLDATISGFDLSHESMQLAFREICEIDIGDDVTFEFIRTEDIRESNDYPGIRIYLKALYEPMAVSLSVDITAGDAITPGAVKYKYPLMFDERSITLMAYPLPTCIAEKLETVISRGITNTRPRDFYDIVMLWRTRQSMIDTKELGRAIDATCAKRGSGCLIAEYHDVITQVAKDANMNARWNTYAKNYSYVGEMSFEEACGAVTEIMDRVQKRKRSGRPRFT